MYQRIAEVQSKRLLFLQNLKSATCLSETNKHEHFQEKHKWFQHLPLLYEPTFSMQLETNGRAKMMRGLWKQVSHGFCFSPATNLILAAFVMRTKPCPEWATTLTLWKGILREKLWSYIYGVAKKEGWWTAGNSTKIFSHSHKGTSVACRSHETPKKRSPHNTRTHEQHVANLFLGRHPLWTLTYMCPKPKCPKDKMSNQDVFVSETGRPCAPCQRWFSSVHKNSLPNTTNTTHVANIMSWVRMTRRRCFLNTRVQVDVTCRRCVSLFFLLNLCGMHDSAESLCRRMCRWQKPQNSEFVLVKCGLCQSHLTAHNNRTHAWMCWCEFYTLRSTCSCRQLKWSSLPFLIANIWWGAARRRRRRAGSRMTPRPLVSTTPPEKSRRHTAYSTKLNESGHLTVRRSSNWILYRKQFPCRYIQRSKRPTAAEFGTS